jgi:hypothetical protein
VAPYSNPQISVIEIHLSPSYLNFHKDLSGL